jgi:hypothetical protein
MSLVAFNTATKQQITVRALFPFAGAMTYGTGSSVWNRDISVFRRTVKFNFVRFI